MAALTEYELKIFAKKVTKLYWPDIIINDDYITPPYIVFCMKAAQAGVSASAKIKFIESIWKGTMPGNISSFADIFKMITGAVKDSIVSYNKGEISELAKAGIVYAVGSQVRMYFQLGPEDGICPDIRI